MSAWTPATPEQLQSAGLDPAARGHHCNRHDHTFLHDETCYRCRTDPGTPIDVAGDENEHDLELEGREAEVVEVARVCYRIGKLLLEGTDRDCTAAAKVLAEGTKAMRTACELRAMRAARAHSRMLIAHERQMSGHRRGN